jgi:hypothetical protein
MRFVRVAYSHATEVVLLLKLGGNEVFFRHKSAEKFMGFAQPTLRDFVSGADSVRRSRPTINKAPSLRDLPLQVINFSFLKCPLSAAARTFLT